MDNFQTMETPTESEKVRMAGTSELPFTIEHTQPYGFYVIKPVKKMVLPPKLSGKYTSPSQAEKAIENYFNELKQFAEKEAKDASSTTQEPDRDRPARAKRASSGNG